MSQPMKACCLASSGSQRWADSLILNSIQILIVHNDRDCVIAVVRLNGTMRSQHGASWECPRLQSVIQHIA